jgi:superfamily II DNA/RNA helicase
MGGEVAREVLVFVGAHSARMGQSNLHPYQRPQGRQKEHQHMKSATFADLGVSEVVVSELAKSEITEPFAVQRMVIPDILAGHDLLAKTPTG